MVRDGQCAKGVDGVGGVLGHRRVLVIALVVVVCAEQRVVGLQLGEGILQLADAGREICDAPVEVFGCSEDKAGALARGE
jgi:hypothetical protein